MMSNAPNASGLSGTSAPPAIAPRSRRPDRVDASPIATAPDAHEFAVERIGPRTSSAILSTANSSASGAVAIGEALSAIHGSGAIDAAIAGGAEVPLSPLCFGAFAIIRAMSAGNDDPAHASRPFDAGRDGFVMAEGAAVLVLEAARSLARGGAGRTPRSGLRRDIGRAPHDGQPRPDGSEAARAADRARRTRRRRRRDGLGQCPRLLDAARRHRRGPGHRASSWASGRDRAAQRHEGALRPPARRVRRHRGRDLRARVRDGWVAGLGQPRRARAGDRRALPGLLREGATAPPTGSCRPRSASGG